MGSNPTRRITDLKSETQNDTFFFLVKMPPKIKSLSLLLQSKNILMNDAVGDLFHSIV